MSRDAFRGPYLSVEVAVRAPADDDRVLSLTVFQRAFPPYGTSIRHGSDWTRAVGRSTIVAKNWVRQDGVLIYPVLDQCLRQRRAAGNKDLTPIECAGDSRQAQRLATIDLAEIPSWGFVCWPLDRRLEQ